MLRPKSQQQRPAIFVLLPVALLLVVIGFVGFIYARNSLIDRWGEGANLKLQRTADRADMRLERDKDWIKFLSRRTTTVLRL